MTHFAGDVVYRTEGWLKKNTDTLHEDLQVRSSVQYSRSRAGVQAVGTAPLPKEGNGAHWPGPAGVHGVSTAIRKYLVISVHAVCAPQLAVAPHTPCHVRSYFTFPPTSPQVCMSSSTSPVLSKLFSVGTINTIIGGTSAKLS